MSKLDDIAATVSRMESDLISDRTKLGDQYSNLIGSIAGLTSLLNETRADLGRFQEHAQDGVTRGIADAAKPLTDLAGKAEKMVSAMEDKKLIIPKKRIFHWFRFRKRGESHVG